MSNLPNIASRWLSQLRDKLPEKRVGLVPADAFFTRKVDLPGELSWEDKRAFIELSLEGNAPFPVEQLAWGFFQSVNSPHAFVYATAKARLKRLGFEDIEQYLQLFPGFISFFGETVSSPTIRFLSQNGVISALYLVPGNPVPEKVISRKVMGDLLTDDSLLEARETMAGSINASGYSLEEGLWLGEGFDILSDDSLLFRHRFLQPEDPGKVEERLLPLSEAELWAADIRDEAFANTERIVRRRSSFIWKSLRVAAVTAIVLLFLQVANFGLSTFNIFRERTLRELEPGAVRVENKLTLAQRLTQSTEEDLNPFLLMEAINPLRPDSIYFEKVRSRAFDSLEVEGKSSEGVTPVNAFADSINQLAFVDSVENNSQTRNNQTSFELTISFSSLPEEPEGGFIIPDEDEETPETEEGGE
ncbi:hypothetical protein G0Q06_08580 [Puniceicoccales bacterium CK1056]|uniref:Uncharacterized protein n=1 Tax=Oceanipulchritudo coccoides TaxID=2706888 RepID=A0A6B2M1B1_9BACT|nr:hypothetical protein [Oceanipulchritudo coccoides]NDV62503.1 hypothetical protein [Oceanipulchritudo coccoides]